MDDKKKRIIKIIASLLALVLVCAGAFGCYLLYRFNCDKSGADYDYSTVYTQKTPTYDVGGDGKFTVLKINDTHFFNGTCENDVKTLDYLKTVLKNNIFDFIVVDGDLVEGFTLDMSFDKYQAIDIFAKMLEDHEHFENDQ